MRAALLPRPNKDNSHLDMTCAYTYIFLVLFLLTYNIMLMFWYVMKLNQLYMN